MFDQSGTYIDGVWRKGRGERTLEVENPATEAVVGLVTESSFEDVDAAVAAAQAAFPAWSRTPVKERAAILRALSAQLADRQARVAEIITSEMGAPGWIARKIQAALPVTVLAAFADLVEEYAFEEQSGRTLVVREAAGVVGAITPWNYPLHQVTCKLAPALAAGCTFVLKPSELTPFVACELMDACEEAGVPAGVVNLVSGSGSTVGATLAGHPGIDVLSFTGSVPAGKRVGELAARNVTRVTLELGGKSANVILDDADLKVAVKVGVANAFLNSGQTCTAWTRMLVPSVRYEDAVDMAAEYASGYRVGDPTAPDTKLGPVVSAAQRARIRGFIEGAESEGARVVAGGAAAPEGLDRGYFITPTVVAEVAPDSRIAQEEVFGPVLSVLRYRDEEDAIAIANNSRYGLHGGVWSSDPERAQAVARRMRTGSVDINGAAYNPMAPFGGYKESGIGREMGAAGLEEYLEIKAIGIP